MKVQCSRCKKSVDSKKAKADGWKHIEVSYIDGYKLGFKILCADCYGNFRDFPNGKEE